MINHLENFQFLAQCLSVNQSSESIKALQKNIRQMSSSWGDVISLANHNLLTPALWVSLTKKGLTGDLPLELQKYLTELHKLNVRRNEKLKSQLIEVIQILNSENSSPALLKGSAYLLLNSFGDIGARIMYDLDILVKKSDLITATYALNNIGYTADFEKEEQYQDHHHSAPLFRPGEFGTIELHHELLFSAASEILPTQTAWDQVENLSIDAHKIHVLSPTHRILHSIIHAQIVDEYHQYHFINLRAIHDLVNIVNNTSDIDWETIKQTMNNRGLTHVLNCHLYNANKLLGLTYPEGFHEKLSYRVNYLRCLSGVRWERVARLESIIQRFSRNKICKHYQCENNWVFITKFRLIYSLKLLSKLGKRLFRFTS